MPQPNMLNEIIDVILRSSRFDERRSRYTIYVSWIVIPVVFLFPLVNNFTGTLATFLMTIIGIIVVANLVVYTTDWQFLKSLIPLTGIVVATSALLYFVYLGYAEGASVMWIFIFPLLAMFMLGIIWGLTCSIAIMLAALWIMSSGESIGAYSYSGEFTLRFVVSFSMVTAMALSYEYWRVLLEVQNERIGQELKSTRDALAEFANVCAWCNSVKAADGSWQTLEQYVSKKEDLQVSHSICPNCVDKQVSK